MVWSPSVHKIDRMVIFLIFIKGKRIYGATLVTTNYLEVWLG